MESVKCLSCRTKKPAKLSTCSRLTLLESKFDELKEFVTERCQSHYENLGSLVFGDLPVAVEDKPVAEEKLDIIMGN